MPDLRDFRRVIAALCSPESEPADASSGARPGGVSRAASEASPSASALSAEVAPSDAEPLPARLVIVPTKGAASVLSETLRTAGAHDDTLALATRDELYDALHQRLSQAPRRLSALERDAMFQAAASEAGQSFAELPFRIRPGLVAEIVRFYDQLRRQSQAVKRFEELISGALGGGELDDVGAERLLRQTRFLVQTFRGYESRAAQLDAVDEHSLRERLLADDAAVPLAHVIVTSSDWIADPAGLFVADFDLLNRLPNLARIDIVSTNAALESGFHERLDRWWPGIDQVSARELVEAQSPVRPLLVCPPPDADLAPLWFTRRDREEELIATARRLTAEPPPSLDRVAIVYKKPLPYLYLADDTLGAMDLPVVATDTLPLAAEPAVAPLDLVLDAVEGDFAREPLVALMASPHFTWRTATNRLSISALDRFLSDVRFLGGAERLLALHAEPQTDMGARAGRSRTQRDEESALIAAQSVVRELTAMQSSRPASAQVNDLVNFLESHLTELDPLHPLADRERRARGAMLQLLRDLASAHVTHHDPQWSIADLASAVRRWVGEHTFAPSRSTTGVHLLDDQAARYGEFDDMTIVGLIESEWPDRQRRNIFYPPNLLKALNWPSESERRAAADARFLDLLSSPTSRIELSTFLLDDEAIVSRSILLDEVPRARLSTVPRADIDEPRRRDERLAAGARDVDGLSPPAQSWLALRSTRSAAADAQFHGSTGPRPARTWSVSALETYIGCPFKFYAQHILRLDEEPDDEEVMDPRRQGQFVHEVFEQFFREWQDAGHREITAANLDVARARFAVVVDAALSRVSEGEAPLERTRLLGSPAAAGLGEAVLRMEAERPVAVVARLLEHKLEGAFTIQTEDGPREVRLRGKADRIDLLEDGTFRLIDYKLGWPPDRGKALQLPVYAICAQQRLDYQGRSWTLGEAVYLAFKGPKRVVPLFSNDGARAETLTRAQQRVADTLDAIARGEFPPAPDDVYRCETCSFSAVCRKDYVGDI